MNRKLTTTMLLVFIPIHVAMFKYGPEYAYGNTGMRDLYRFSGRLAVGAVVGLVVRASVVVALVALAG